jgi:hypothetical protein
MRIHIILTRNAAGAIKLEYLGEDRAAALAVYQTCGEEGETVELYSYPELTRRRNVLETLRKKKK